MLLFLWLICFAAPLYPRFNNFSSYFLYSFLIHSSGYLSKTLFAQLYRQGLVLITGIKKNMKNYLIPMLDKILLRKRFIIETIFGYIKEQFNITPSKHRSPSNFFASLFAAIIAYQIKPSKPRMAYP